MEKLKRIISMFAVALVAALLAVIITMKFDARNGQQMVRETTSVT